MNIDLCKIKFNYYYLFINGNNLCGHRTKEMEIKFHRRTRKENSLREIDFRLLLRLIVAKKELFTYSLSDDWK